MNYVTCEKCKQEFGLEKTFVQEDVLVTKCPICGAVFEVDEEVEMSDAMSERVDDVENAVYALCCELAQNSELEWDIAYIGEIADVVCDILVDKGIRVNYPAVVTNEDESQEICEWVEPATEEEKQKQYEELLDRKPKTFVGCKTVGELKRLIAGVKDNTPIAGLENNMEIRGEYTPGISCKYGKMKLVKKPARDAFDGTCYNYDSFEQDKDGEMCLIVE